MARLDQGLLGGYSGKLGTTVGASWKGINVVRTYQPNVANPNTQAQHQQRTIFSDFSKLASFILPDFIKPLWNSRAKKMSGYNAFIQANLNHPNASFSIDPEILILSEGLIGVPADTSLSYNRESGVLIGWSTASLPLYGSDDDELFVLIFNPEGELLAKSAQEAQRSDESLTLLFGAGSLPATVVAVIAWRSSDGKFQSNTQRFTLTEED